MEITFNEIRAREIVNIFDGKRLGRAQDIVFEKETGQVSGIVVPGISKFLRKADDIFIPMQNIRKIGEDVILVSLVGEGDYQNTKPQPRQANKNTVIKNDNYARYKRPSVKLK